MMAWLKIDVTEYDDAAYLAQNNPVIKNNGETAIEIKDGKQFDAGYNIPALAQRFVLLTNVGELLHDWVWDTQKGRLYFRRLPPIPSH